MRKGVIRCGAAAAALLLAWATTDGIRASDEIDAFDYAFRFASAIKVDDKDRGRAQESVVQDLAAAGALDAAISRADRIDGWRRGVAYADLATRLARAGRREEARALVTKAREVSGEITGWQQQRITAHIAQALVHLGDTGEARRISQDLAAADGQYGGQAAATIALGEAAEEGIDKSMESLDKMKSDADFETAWWRTVGYVSLARRPAVSRAEKTKALAAAYESAQTISGWKRAEALESIASEYHELGEKRQALEALRAAEAIVAPLPDTLPVKAVLMSNLARAWTGLGHDAHARDLLAQAAALVPSAPLVDRPGAYANVASSYLELKDKRESARSYDRALAEAESLVNARPRALAVVDVCRAMGRNRVDLEPATRARLDRLLEGLSEPW